MATNEEILEEFYNEYFRAPEIKEFEGWGGDIYDVKKKYKSYKRFLLNFGLELQSKAETYEVVHVRTNEVEFTGTLTDIAFEYNTTRQRLIRHYSNDWVLNEKYIIRHKPYMPKDEIINATKKNDPKKQKELDKAIEGARNCLNVYKKSLKDYIRNTWIDNDGNFINDSNQSDAKLQRLYGYFKDAMDEICRVKEGD